MANFRQNYNFARGQGNIPHHEAAIYAAQQAAGDAAYAARQAVSNTGNTVVGIPGAALGAVASVPGNVGGYLLRHPVSTALAAGTLGAGYLANQSMGNPIGAAIQNAGNMLNGSEWDNQVGQPTAIDAYNRMGGVGDNLYQQQLNDSIGVAERAGNFQHRLAQEAAAQQYGQELGLQVNRLQAEREMQENQLAAQQANQLLNGYLQMIDDASHRAAAAAGNRY